jgi:hypothetical protein
MRTVGPNDHAVRRGVFTQRGVAGLASIRIKMPERRLMLGGVPNAAIRGRRDIVRVLTFWNRIFHDLARGAAGTGDQQHNGQQNSGGVVHVEDPRR